MEFAEKVRFLRTSKGWTQAELARRLEVTMQTVLAYEDGTYPRQQLKYGALARVFGVDADYFRSEQDGFFTQRTAWYGLHGQALAKGILELTARLFEEASLSDADEIAFLRDLQGLYLEARQFAPERLRAE